MSQTVVARWKLLSRGSSLCRSSHSVSVTADSRVFLYGGELQPRTPVDASDASRGAVHVFDIAKVRFGSAQWATALSVNGSLSPSIPEPRVGATTSIAGEHLYLWGGRGGLDMAPLPAKQSGVWKCSILGNKATWERIIATNEEDAPQARSYHAMASCNNKLYIHAGCPASGRINELHCFDIGTNTWSTLAPGPEPGRGGTVLAYADVSNKDYLLRFGGFAGYELGADHALDIYDISSNSWRTETPQADEKHGYPGPRSVHGFIGFKSNKLPSGVALLYHGERDASSLGHAGAGTFWSDVWVLNHDGKNFAWQFVPVEGDGPEGRGWFPSASSTDSDGNTQAVLQGGLLTSNERSDELWLLSIDN